MVPEVCNVNFHIMLHCWTVKWQQVFYAWRTLKQENLYHYYYIFSSNFMTVLSAFIARWYWYLDGTKIYYMVDSWNIVWNLVQSICEDLHIFKSVDRYAYMCSNPGVILDIYSWATISSHATMDQVLKYKFDGNLAMSACRHHTIQSVKISIKSNSEAEG